MAHKPQSSQSESIESSKISGALGKMTRCFWDGLGVESDKFKSGELFKEAAINENKMKTDAKLYYAYFLYITDKPQEFKKYIIEVANEEKDEEKARRFLLKAANRGHHNTIKTCEELGFEYNKID
ncbi:hypothetical protein C2G38_2253606 [Gigaspora rosea]|uniref:Uncharacterized protein n=1 Tax=Gigaspora rosea TaxID=44941 RepID=A0A397U685_9GLOM|nr:hypothetical protein C2G38_2253606 [Gigaspora rosea]